MEPQWSHCGNFCWQGRYSSFSFKLEDLNYVEGWCTSSLNQLSSVPFFLCDKCSYCQVPPSNLFVLTARELLARRRGICFCSQNAACLHTRNWRLSCLGSGFKSICSGRGYFENKTITLFGHMGVMSSVAWSPDSTTPHQQDLIYL